MGNITKAEQIHHLCGIGLGKIINFGATPYESTTFPINATPGLSSGMLWEGHYSTFSTFAPAGGIQRADVKLQTARFSGMGWQFTHRAKGRGYDYSQFKGNRSMSTFMAELIDGGASTWVNRSGGRVANSIILKDGISSQRGQYGLDILTIQSATPDYFLGELELPTMDYILGKPANAERKAWYDMCTYGFDTMKPAPVPLPTSPELIRASAQNQLGYTFKDTSGVGINATTPKYNDPLGGFAYYTDDYTLTIGQAMQPRPCNENHLVAMLSSSRILAELFANHVKVNGRSINETFNMEVRTDLDIEYNVFTAGVSGTINSIIQTLAESGVWRAWWDSRCNFHFIPDYYANANGEYSNVPSLIIGEGPSLIGDLEVNLGTDQLRVNRAEVKPMSLLSPGDATDSPLVANVNMALGAVYPPGTPKGGNDVSMDSYMGFNTGEEARRLYNRANAKTTFKWSNFPYPMLAMGMANRIASLTASDPKGNWSFADKRFVVTDVTVELNEPDRPGGGYYLCSIAGVEI